MINRFSPWWHDVPLPSEPDAQALFLSWYTFDESAQCWNKHMPANPDTNSNDSTRPSDSAGNADTTSSELTLVTWNVDAFGARPEDRMAAIISTLQGQGATAAAAPDVLFFQEVSRAMLQFLLNDAWIRGRWYSSESGASVTGWPRGQQFTTATFLSRDRFTNGGCGGGGGGSSSSSIGPIWRTKYPSRFGRDALCCDVFLPSSSSGRREGTTRVRLVNVHLDSLPIQPSKRPRQVAIVANMLRGAGRGLVAGDFNPVLPEDDTLLVDSRLVDVWTALHPGEEGFTWGIDGQQPFPAGRLDKVGVVGLQATAIEVLHPGVLPSSRENDEGETASEEQSEQRKQRDEDEQPLPWSDHSGLRFSCALVDAQHPQV
ncbi:tyrosyl-DNA phosphodiesterase 2 [Diplogelasinospora grovesii]|uniref:Tyrosyl-DNA phosphodiesterase 2 n=1 Tax=Diplogelasinospora grovesii TaxID=303347 RepID=A0AAN6N7W9_9PEZI|nr:tyrosyl-DNA phosphodiesterase 2 [Diplogelasinospora grovesii]